MKKVKPEMEHYNLNFLITSHLPPKWPLSRTGGKGPSAQKRKQLRAKRKKRSK